MFNSQEQESKIFIELIDCQVKISNHTSHRSCRCVFYENKAVEFYFNHDCPKAKSLSKNEANICLQKTIHLDLNYSIFIQRQVNQESNHSYLQYKIIITEIYSSQKIQIKCEQKLKDYLHQYFKECVWIQENIEQKFEVVKQIKDKEKLKHPKKFLLLKDLSTFENRFVKIYEKKNFFNRKTKKLEISSIVRQVYFQNLLKHKNLMSFNLFILDKDNFYIFYRQKPTKIMSHQMLLQSRMPSIRIKGILKQTLKVLQELFSLQIIHNNIQLSSIFLIQNNKKWKILLGEFQEAHFIDENFGVKIDQKDKCFFAPELIKGNSYHNTLKGLSDVFSLGVVFYEILFKKELYNTKMIKAKLQNEPINFKFQQFKLLNSECANLLQQMLEFDPNFRITPIDALKHDFFANSQSLNFIQIFVLKSIRSASLQSTGQDMFFDMIQQRRRDRFSDGYSSGNGLLAGHSTNIQDVVLQRVTNRLKRKKSDCHSSYSQATLQTFNEMEMDDSHSDFRPRDIRIMRPAWNIHQMAGNSH